MVVAKTDKAHRALSKQFAEKTEGPLKRGYLALVWGAPDRPKGTIDAPLDRHPHARDKQAVREGGRSAVTHWQVLERIPGRTASRSLASSRARSKRAVPTRSGCISLISDTQSWAMPPTAPASRPRPAVLGPQARAALEALGRQALHAYLLAIEHPETGDALEFQSELPGDLRRLRDALHMESREAGPEPRK